MIRILNAEPFGYSAEARAILARVGGVTEQALARAELLAALPEYDVLIVRLAHQLDRELLDVGARLKVIVSATTGLDHIDTNYAATRGIAVLSLRGETAFLRTVHATAEFTWAILLALVRRIAPAFEAVKCGEWDRDRYRGHELDGKHLALLGFGRLGTRVARYGLAFGMQVSTFDPHTTETMAGVRRATSLDELLTNADVLSIHVPLNEITTGMLGARELALLPDHAVVVNTSRGEILDEPALVAALTAGRLAGAALDVVTGERAEGRGAADVVAYARSHGNLLLTPHIAGATHESMTKTEIFMAHKLEEFLRRTPSPPSLKS